MDQMTRRISCYPDGSKIIKTWDNGVIVKGKLKALYEADHAGGVNKPDHDHAKAYPAAEVEEKNWETQLEYF